jgi:hypothetical protein
MRLRCAKRFAKRFPKGSQPLEKAKRPTIPHSVKTVKIIECEKGFGRDAPSV